MSTKRVALGALIFTSVYNLLFFQVSLGLGWGVFFFLLNLYFFLMQRGKNPNIGLGIASSVTSIIFAFLFAFRSNEIVQVINFGAATFFSLAAVYFYQQPESFSTRVFDFIFLPLATIKRSVMSLFGVLGREQIEDNTKESIIGPVVKGLVVGGMVIGVLLLLFQSADPIFGKLSGRFFSNFAERVIVSVVLFGLVFVLGLKHALNKKEDKSEENLISRGKSVELTVITGCVASLLLIFILVQLRYLFGTVGERELNELGINSLTYSEYVRKGFFELLFSSIITSGVVLYSLGYLHKLKNNSRVLLQLLSALLTIETGFLLLSAVKRLILYSDAHGLTRARMFGFIFLVWLALILFTILWRVIWEMKKGWWLTLTLGITLETLLLINIVNIDGLIADKYKPTVNKETDYYYLTSLSPDASDVWKEALLDSGRTIQNLEGKVDLSGEDYRQMYWARGTTGQLKYWRNYLQKKYDVNPKWQSLNFSEYQAYNTILKEKALFEQLDELTEKARKLDEKVLYSIKDTTVLDRAVDPPLLR